VTPSVSGTVAEACAATARRHPHNAFLEILPPVAAALGIEAHAYRYEEVSREIDRLRDGYRTAGYGHGHRAGLLLGNRPEFIFHWLALNGLGVSIVPINPEWRAAELEYLIEHSELSLAVSLPERRGDLEHAARAIHRPLSLTGPDGGNIEPPATPPPAGARAPDVDTECALLYTSGTTGRPKGCVLPNEYFLWAGTWYATLGGLCEIRPGVERMITPLPLTHMNALACSTMCMLLTGGCLVLLDRFHPGSWWDCVRAGAATIVHYLGVMPAMLLAADPSPQDRDHAVRFGFGAGVDPRLHARFEARFGFPLIEAWAMTETGAGAVVIASEQPRDVGTGCFGIASRAVECRIVDEAGSDVAAGTPGEFLVRRAGVAPRFGFFRGYLKDDAATAGAWAGGWFHTGDLVTRDGAGRFRFVDRRKNVIRRSGENISAVEVESVLAQHPAVRAAAVAAVPDPVRGDEVFACIVLREPQAAAEPLARDVTAFCLERLAYFKAPGYVAFEPRLPLTPTEKIQRAELKALARDRLDGHACFDVRSMKRRRDP
jgi:acyl-CoA synthetase (AMP-forming)/AMP-acid ligase II